MKIQLGVIKVILHCLYVQVIDGAIKKIKCLLVYNSIRSLAFTGARGEVVAYVIA